MSGMPSLARQKSCAAPPPSPDSDSPLRKLSEVVDDNSMVKELALNAEVSKKQVNELTARVDANDKLIAELGASTATNRLMLEALQTQLKTGDAPANEATDDPKPKRQKMSDESLSYAVSFGLAVPATLVHHAMHFSTSTNLDFSNVLKRMVFNDIRNGTLCKEMGAFVTDVCIKEHDSDDEEEATN